MTLPPLNHHFFQWVSPVPHQPTPLRQSLSDHRSEESQTAMKSIDAFTPMSDQDRVSPYNIRTISDENREIYKIRELLVDSRPNLQSNLKGLYCRQKGELLTNKVLVLSLIQSHFQTTIWTSCNKFQKNLLLLVGGTSCYEALLCDWKLYGHCCPWNRARPDYTLPSCHHCSNKILEWIALTFL